MNTKKEFNFDFSKALDKVHYNVIKNQMVN